MKTSEFNAYYNAAVKANIETSDLFNCAGFFWLGLTDKQLHKMCELLKAQRCQTVVVNDAVWYVLQNGLRIKSV